MTYSILITCEKCGSKDITFYRQMRRDHVWTVTARCVNMHIPNKYKTFYPVDQFELGKLPDLPKKKEGPRQLSWIDQMREDYKNG